MDKMSLISILTVAVPEAILNIYIGFVFTGQRSKLYLDDKLNLIRMIATVSLMVVAAVVTRATASDLITVLLINILLYSLILFFVYRIKWYEAVISVMIFVGILITTEFAYMIQFFALLNISLEEYLASDLNRFLISVPQRAIQIFIIASFWNWDIVYLNLQAHKKIRNLVLVCALVLGFTEALFYTLFMYSLDVLTPPFKIYYSIACMMFVVINVLLSRMIIAFSKRL